MLLIRVLLNFASASDPGLVVKRQAVHGSLYSSVIR
jgi:hypothetical protein